MSEQHEVRAYVALGSNLGDRHAHMRRGFAGLATLPGTRLLARSGLLETEPVGPIAQGPFLNAVAELRTLLPARELLAGLQAIERDCGRVRVPGERWGPRTLDLDLLVYGGAIIHDPGLTVPHPRLHERLFVLVPLAQIAPDLVVPGTDATAAQLLAACTEAGSVARPR